MDDDIFNIEFQGERLQAKVLTTDQLAAVRYIQSGDGELTIDIMGAMISSAISAGAWRKMLVGQASGHLTMKQIVSVFAAVVDGSVAYHKAAQDAKEGTPEVRAETVQSMSPAAVLDGAGSYVGTGVSEPLPDLAEASSVPRTFRAGD